ncbi:uncharacterized protein METZ01_LOCUS124906, partial [marine metagenome]
VNNNEYPLTENEDTNSSEALSKEALSEMAPSS